MGYVMRKRFTCHLCKDEAPYEAALEERYKEKLEDFKTLYLALPRRSVGVWW
jgi:hypothetical protein